MRSFVRSYSIVISRCLVLLAFLYFSAVFTVCDGNRWTQHRSVAADLAPVSQSNTSSGGKWFTPFDATDWTLWGLTALADIGDFSSSYSQIVRDQPMPSGSPSSCSPGFSPPCFSGRVGDPILGFPWGTQFPSEIQAATSFLGIFAVETALAWALPHEWRDAMFGVFIGIGAADTAWNGARGGVWFKF